jgi:hypothetical protein
LVGNVFLQLPNVLLGLGQDDIFTVRHNLPLLHWFAVAQLEGGLR